MQNIHKILAFESNTFFGLSILVLKLIKRIKGKKLWCHLAEVARKSSKIPFVKNLSKMVVTANINHTPEKQMLDSKELQRIKNYKVKIKLK